MSNNAWSELTNAQQEVVAGGLKDFTFSFSDQTIDGGAAGGNSGDTLRALSNFLSFANLVDLIVELGGLF